MSTCATASRRPNGFIGLYPDGRERLAWPGITHFRMRPTWVRHSDFTQNPARIVELTA